MSMLEDRIPDLLGRVDLAELVRRFGGAEAKPGTHHCPNPAHEDRNPSFTVRAGRWKCWSACATGGDAIDLLVWLRRSTKAEAIDELAAMVGLERSERAAVAANDDRRRLLRWCAGRGWGQWTAEELALSVVADAYGRLRVRFPFRLGDQVAYHQDRAMADARPRWLSPKGGRPIPYEADRMRLAAERGHVFIVEGVTDVAALVDTYTSPAVVGVPGVEAWRSSWGAAFRGLSVYVIADNDKAGGTFRSKLSEDLAPVARAVRHVDVPDAHKDVAAWRKSADPGRFDDEMMAAVEATGGQRLQMAS